MRQGVRRRTDAQAGFVLRSAQTGPVARARPPGHGVL